MPAGRTARAGALGRLALGRDRSEDRQAEEAAHCSFDLSSHASSTNPETWGTFEQTVALVEQGKADGIGYALCPPHVGVDLDEELPEADKGAILLKLDSYSERSVSGTGYHVVLRADLNGAGRHPEGIGVFQQARFFYFTGEHVPGTPTTIEERRAELEEILARYLPAPAPNGKGGVEQALAEFDDRELLERARLAKNGVHFERLWAGEPNGYPSQSEADLALCGALAFWAGPDPARIDSLFRRSGLMRAKWDEPRGETTYGAQTIARALEGRREFYSPPTVEPPRTIAPAAEPGADWVGDEPPLVDAAEPYATLDLSSFLAKPPTEPDWDWHGYHALGDVVLIVGDPGVGKSLNELAKAVKGRAGGEHLGEALAARRQLFFDLESPEDVVHGRLYAFGLRGNEEGFQYVYRPSGLNLLEASSVDRLRETIKKHRSEVVVIDSLRRAAPGLDENDSRQVSVVFTALREIAAELRVTIVVVHHPRKPVSDAKVEALYAARGSGDLISSVDSYLFYRKLSGGLIRIEHGKARRGREHEHVHYRIVEGESGEPVIELVDVEQAVEKPLEPEYLEQVYAAVVTHAPATNATIERAVGGNASKVRKGLANLVQLERIFDRSLDEVGTSSEGVADEVGRRGRRHAWLPVNHAGLSSSGSLLDELGRTSAAGSATGSSSTSSGPPIGAAETMDEPGRDLIEDVPF